MLHDLRYALRTLRHNPGFTIAALLTLGLGIGATTAIFTVVYGVLLRPLPYPEPNRLVYVSSDAWGIFSSGTEYSAWKNRSQTLSQIAAYINSQANLTGGVAAARVTLGIASASFFQMLGVRPAVGRVFLNQEDLAGAPPVVILSHPLWKSRFGGDPSVVGKTLTLDAKNYTVVGVLPAGFLVPDQYGDDYGLWMSFSADPDGPPPILARVIGRLKPGVSYQRARSELNTILQSTLKRGRQKHALVMPWHDDITGKAKAPLLVFLAAIGFVLLIASVNVANLMLSRAAGREREMAVRLALGAGRRRILRQLLTESTLMALFGGALGLAVAIWAKDLLVAFISADLPTLEPIQLDYRVLGFTLCLSLLTGLAFGFAPAFQASGIPLNESLKEAGRSTTEGGSGRRLRGLLVVCEVALAMVLLIGAGLLFRSFLRLSGIDMGFRLDRILCLNIDVTPAKYPRARDQATFFKQAMERTKSLAGVQSVAGSTSAPFEGYYALADLKIEGQPDSNSTISWTVASSDYFHTLGIPLIQGRYFADSDREGEQMVAIVNQSFARRYFPAGNCLGRRVESWVHKNEWLNIVGVVGDVRPDQETDASPEIYLSYLQAGQPHMTLVVRTAGDPMNLAAAVRSQIASVDKDQPPYLVTTLDKLRTGSIASRRVNMLLLGAFAGLALVLGSIGIYGVISYSVSQRTHEIGIRMALGAEQEHVLSLIVKQGLLLVGAGEVLGLAAALVLNKVISSMVFQVSTTDPLTYAGVSLVWAAVALSACYVPARRATKVDPIVALHSE